MIVAMFPLLHYDEKSTSFPLNSIFVFYLMSCVYGNQSCSRMSSLPMGVFTYFFYNGSMTNLFVSVMVDLKQNGPDSSLLNPSHHNLSSGFLTC